MKQRPSQTATFWKTNFQITDASIEALYHLFVEKAKPYTIDDLGLFFVQQALEAEEKALREELAQGEVYQPNKSYAIGDRLVFTQYEYLPAIVTDMRDGFHPEYGDFTIIDVEFEGAKKATASFASNLQIAHPLIDAEKGAGAGEDGAALIREIYQQFQPLIQTKVEKRLHALDDFICFNQSWFLADMLVPVQEGLLNIVDAAIDINGGPLNVDSLIEQLDLKSDDITDEALQFSVNHRLDHDERFMNVGIADNPMWYLERLKPTNLDAPPHNLIVKNLSFNPDNLASDMRTLLSRIDDEDTPVELAAAVVPNATEVTFVLNYPHRRAGTLPVLPNVEPLLPDVDGERIIALQFVDGQSGEEIVGWYVSEYHYIAGFEDYFTKYQLPVGAFIVLKKTDNPLKLIIDYIPQRTQREWVRVATVKNNQIGFEMKNRQLTCRYDELMVIGEEGSAKIDEAWERINSGHTPIASLIDRIFPELLKLTSQDAVHTNTLYSAINVARRCPPGPLLQELSEHPHCEWIGHGYWTFKGKK